MALVSPPAVRSQGPDGMGSAGFSPGTGSVFHQARVFCCRERSPARGRAAPFRRSLERKHVDAAGRVAREEVPAVVPHVHRRGPFPLLVRGVLARTRVAAANPILTAAPKPRSAAALLGRQRLRPRNRPRPANFHDGPSGTNALRLSRSQTGRLVTNGPPGRPGLP